MFGDSVNAAILERAKTDPNETCGYVLDGEVVFVPNVSPDPVNNFETRDLPDDVDAIFHSHPGGPFYPSKPDMEQQLATAVPWGIAATTPAHEEVFWFGDGVPLAPLIGRGFRHGVTDCYELIRDFYTEVHGITLKSHPRSWEWWHEGETMYDSFFAETGFIEVPMAEILPGDVFLATIHAHTPNHAGIYIGDGLILHHTASRQGYDPSRLSTVEPAARWMKFLTKVLRHENNQIDRTPRQGIWP